MYIESVPNRNSPPAILLRESFRDGAKIKKRTIANLSDWPAELVEGLRTLLKGGTATPADRESIIVRRALPHGHVAAVLAAVARARQPLRGKDQIGLKVGAVFNRYKMAKHFELDIGEATFAFRRKTDVIAAEAALDGFYVVRTNLPNQLEALFLETDNRAGGFRR